MHVVERRTLAQGPGQQAAGIAAGALWMTPERSASASAASAASRRRSVSSIRADDRSASLGTKPSCYFRRRDRLPNDEQYAAEVRV
jgi:hypothetical protein